MKKIAILLLLGLVTIQHQSKAQYDEAALEILDAMSSKYQSMVAFKAVFKYTLENPAENLTEVFEGKVTVKKDKYFLEMEGQEIINDGETVWTYLPELNEVNISTYSEEEQDISLSNIFTLYQSGYKYLYIERDAAKNAEIIDLVPEDVNNSYFKIRLTIGEKDRILKSFMIFDKNGNRFLYEILSFKEDKTVTDAFFTFDEASHPDVEVLDFR